MVNKFISKSVFLLLISLILMPSVYAASFTMATVRINDLWLRTSAGSSVTISDVDNSRISLGYPRRVEILDSTTVSGVIWKKIYTNYYSNNYTGWVNASYLQDITTYELDDNYANELRNIGFTEDYILPLQKLHALYPNWSFVPSRYNGVGLDWNYILDRELDPAHKNLIQNSSDVSLWSTDGSVYSNGVYQTFEGYWKAPSRQTVGFYMDPRNWLTERMIFMFEQLSYNSSSHTADVVQKMLNNTFMEGTFEYNGTNMRYADAFVEAGAKYNVSPVQLASRAIQEQGPRGSATINMESDGKLYYNIFNINASGDNIVAKALATAINNGWDSPYGSIMGGASLISRGYSSVGQDTNYYQKFNTISDTYGLFSNQYMANVRALTSESNTSFLTYKNNDLLNSPFTFKIPIYNNMPESTTLAIEKNGDNTLKSINVTNCSLNPEFYSGSTDYTCYVASNVETVTVTATQTNPHSSISGSGTFTLENSETVIELKVTAANGDVKIYKITVIKAEVGTETPSDIISYIGYDNNNNIISGIELGTRIEDIIANVRNNYAISSINVKDKNNNDKSNGVIATGDTLEISSAGVTTKFIVKVKGDINSDGNINISDLAMIKAHMLGKNSLSGIYGLAADINGDGTVNIGDLAMVKAHMLGKANISK